MPKAITTTSTTAITTTSTSAITTTTTSAIIATASASAIGTTKPCFFFSLLLLAIPSFARVPSPVGLQDEKFACCLKDGTCFDGPAAIANECEFLEGVLTPGATCQTVKCGSCCIKGVCISLPMKKCIKNDVRKTFPPPLLRFLFHFFFSPRLPNHLLFCFTYQGCYTPFAGDCSDCKCG